MSLNGLGDPKIKEAYEKAASEAGGWFLLKYASRDEVELFTQGNGGSIEMRDAVASYEDSSPLFGFLRYRRRNVLIKYIPDGCSRLVQARVTVHFSAFIDHFSPHDVAFSINSSKELRDTALSAACSLHTASGSTSSSTSSLQRRRLMEIAEEEESRVNRKSTVSEISEGESYIAKAVSISESSVTPSTSDPVSLAGLQPWEIDTADLSVSFMSSDFQPEFLSRSDSSKNAQRFTDSFTYPPFTSSSRNKVRLGPRPSQDVGWRPHTLANSPYHPISTLPAGLKSFAKGAKSGKEGSRSPSDAENHGIVITSPPSSASSSMFMADLITRPHSSNERPITSSGFSFRSIPSPTISVNSKIHTLDSARARLMKAQEMRKKKMEAVHALDSSSIQANIILPDITPPASPIVVPECEKSLSMLPKLNSDNLRLSNETTTNASIENPEDLNSSSCIESAEGYFEAHIQGAQSTNHSLTVETPKVRASGLNTNSLALSKHQIPLPDTTELGSTINTEEASEPKSNFNIMDSGASKSFPVLFRPMEKLSLETTQGLENEFSKSKNLAENCFVSPHPNNPGSMDSTSLVGASKTITKSSELFLENSTNKSNSSEKSTCNSPASIPSLQNQSGCLQIFTEPIKRTKATSAKSENSSSSRCPSLNLIADDVENFEAIETNLAEKNVLKTNEDAENQSLTEIECNFSSDDEFMDELQSAVIEDAKPVSVAKSSISPNSTPPRSKKNESKSSLFDRESLNLMSKDQITNSHLSAFSRSENSRSVSFSAASSRDTSPRNLNMVKKINLGTGISQRIKALERLSSLGPESNVSQGTTAGIPTFFSVRKTTVRYSSKSKSKSDRPNSFVRTNPSPESENPLTTSFIQTLTDESRRAESTAQSLSESFSITAHIVRHPSQVPSKPSLVSKARSDYSALSFQDSQLEFDRPQNSSKVENKPEANKNFAEKQTINTQVMPKGRRYSLTILKDLFNERRHSISRSRRSLSLEHLTHSPTLKLQFEPPSIHKSKVHSRNNTAKNQRSSTGRDTVNIISPTLPCNSVTASFDENTEHRSSRTSRMFQLMSTSMSARRKSTSQPTSYVVTETTGPSTSDNLEFSKTSYPLQYTLNTSTTIGDVNVQFPDSLLWKRKTILLDTQGFLILAPITSIHPYHTSREKQNLSATRKFHMSEFKMPFVPDVEIEELPNSIILDLLEGEILQIACQDRPTQGQMLSILQKSYRNWVSRS